MTLANLANLVAEISNDSGWAVYAEGLEADSPARYGQTQFENGGLRDDKSFVIDGEMANRAQMVYSDGDPAFIAEHSSPEEFFNWLKDEGWID